VKPKPVVVGLAGIGVVLAVALALFQPWKLFIDNKVNEAFPAGAKVVTATTVAKPATTAATATAVTTAAAATPETTAAAASAANSATTAAPGASATTASAAKPPTTAAPTTAAPTTTVAATTTVAPTTTVPEPVTGEFRGLAHGTSGTARVVTLEGGKRILRIEDLDTDNGPDLVVYLSPQPADGNGFGNGAVNLGRLKGNKGSQNYELPADVDPANFGSVVIWCKRFSVAFGAAPLVVSPA
jgi:Electron transfer DM13